MNRSPRAYFLPALLALLTAGCDLGTKVWATRQLSDAPIHQRTPCHRRGDTGPFILTRIPTDGIVLVAQHIDLVYTENCVAAFGLLDRVPGGLRRVALLGAAAIAFAALVTMERRLPASRRFARAALALVLGGALGNLADRIVRGFVVDFVYVHHGQLQWPVFNVADIAISCGLGLLAIDTILADRRAAAA